MKEIKRLKAMLEREGIPFEWCEQEPITGNAHIYYPDSDNRCKCSVVQGWCTYGGEDNLLEIMGLLTEKEHNINSVVGWLTAKEVFDRIKKHWKRRKKK